MRAACGTTLVLLMLCSSNVLASDLIAQIRQFFQQQYARYPDWQIHVQVKSPPDQWPACETPEITQPVNSKPWGNISLSVRCGSKRKFIQARVQVHGHYITAKRHFVAGDKITPADILMQKGELTTLPPGTLVEPEQVSSAVILRNITAGQPLTRTMLRPAWVIHAGQAVQILAMGAGFNISSAGKAMNNAAANDTVRVRMTSGQIINGIAGEDGIIRIML